MGKAQKSFADKAKKMGSTQIETRQVRVIRSVKDPKTGVVKFFDRMETVVDKGQLDQHLSELVQAES